MGDTCTRNCGFCGVNSGRPLPLDKKEPDKIAAAIKEMDLLYAVITSVTRDDLDDGGASHFAETIKAIKNLNPDTRVECLIPDFGGNKKDLEILLSGELDVLNHNIETVESNYGKVRSSADYNRSLKLLKSAKEIRPDIYTKSGFMVGLGESREQILKLLEDLKESKVDIITIGQYLQPTSNQSVVDRWVTTEEFAEWKEYGLYIGFGVVESGPLVRSSYHAEEQSEKYTNTNVSA